MSLQNAGDVESTLTSLSVLDELLSAGELRSAFDYLNIFDMAISCKGLTIISSSKQKDSVKPGSWTKNRGGEQFECRKVIHLICSSNWVAMSFKLLKFLKIKKLSSKCCKYCYWKVTVIMSEIIFDIIV